MKQANTAGLQPDPRKCPGLHAMPPRRRKMQGPHQSARRASRRRSGNPEGTPGANGSVAAAPAAGQQACTAARIWT
eukprot:11295927-Alexandrium_andersonii.AAC.1